MKFQIRRIPCLAGYCWELTIPGGRFRPHFRSFPEAVKGYLIRVSQ